MQSQTLSFAITHGNSVSYPFDVFENEFVVSASAPTSPTEQDSLPVVLSLGAGIQAYSFDNSVSNIDADRAGQLVSVKLFRSLTTRFFSVFVIAVCIVPPPLIIIDNVGLVNHDSSLGLFSLDARTKG